MTLKDKFNSIDQSRITADQKAFLDKMKNVTKDFTLENKEVNDKVEGALDKMITSFKEKMPDAIKTTKKVVEPKTAKAKKTTKVATKTTVPKRTVMSVAKEIRKEGESWADAQKRAGKIIKGDKADVSKVVKTELEKLKKFISGRKELQGISGTDIPRDSVRQAKPRGVRTVTKSGETSNQYGTFENKLGRRYWETRDRHADRLAPNYPKDAPLLENGGDFQAGVYAKGGLVEEGDRVIITTTSLGKGYVGMNGVVTSRKLSNDKYSVKLSNGLEMAFDKDEFKHNSINPRFELGGNVQSDLAGHTGGSLGTGDPSMLDGFSNTAYTGLVGETGAMSSGEMFMNGGGLPSGINQSYMITEALGNPAQHYKNGGSIPNNYEGRTPKDIWDNLSSQQRSHFLHDHNKSEIQSTPSSLDAFSKKSYNFLPTKVKKSFDMHVATGQYKAGGMLNANERYVLEIKGLTGLRKEAIESYIADNNLTDSEVLNIVVGLGRKQLKGVDVSVAIAGKKNNSFSKKLIEFAKSDKAMKLEEGGQIDAFTLRLVKGTAGNPDEALTEPKSVSFADGGAINADLNKKVYDLAKKKKLTISNYTPSEYDKLMGQALVESLTSANFHEEAKQVVAKLENKKWSKQLYESEYFDPSFEAGAFGNEVARICEWDGEDILNAYYFLTKMQGSKVHNVISQFLVVVRPSDAKMYVVHADIDNVKVYKGSKVVTYSGKDVLNGANILKNGGGIEKKAYYVPKREVVSVQLKNGESIKPANGYWIKKDAKQVVKAEKGVYIEVLEDDIDMTDDNVMRVKPSKTSKSELSEMEWAEKHNAGSYEFMKEGGKVGFADKSKAIAKRFVGKKVEPKYQREYGKTYSKEEASEVGDKIVGKMVAKEKMMAGGKTKKGNGEAMLLAKKIRKDGEKWTDAVKRAWLQLK